MTDFDLDQDGWVEAFTFDSNGDGYDDVIAHDQDENGLVEVMEMDSNGDGYIGMRVYDDAQDGVFERATVDEDGNGDHETHAFDVDQDGVLDTVVRDANFNGMDDAQELTGMVIGSPSYDGVAGLVIALAGEAGQAVFGEPDSDSDGWDDSEDARPYDPAYR